MNIPTLKRVVKDRIEAVEVLIRMYEEKLEDLKRELQILQTSLRYLEEKEGKVRRRESEALTFC